jgi:hypothetical protein
MAIGRPDDSRNYDGNGDEPVAAWLPWMLKWIIFAGLLSA